jgi:hypothetical protein
MLFKTSTPNMVLRMCGSTVMTNIVSEYLRPALTRRKQWEAMAVVKLKG